MPFECPFPNCDKTFETFYALKKHVILAHCENMTKCPICGKECRDLTKHCRQTKDRNHQVLYALIRRGGKSKSDYLKRCVDLACNLLRNSYKLRGVLCEDVSSHLP